jgi:hypothetical protein
LSAWPRRLLVRVRSGLSTRKTVRRVYGLGKGSRTHDDRCKSRLSSLLDRIR